MTYLAYIKFSYHFFVFLLLGYIALFLKINIYIKVLLFTIAFIHLYDSWWFLKYTGNAPI